MAVNVVLDTLGIPIVAGFYCIISPYTLLYTEFYISYIFVVMYCMAVLLQIQ